MRDMLTTGQFSPLTHPTVKRLRLYDRLGVLPAVMVGLTSGYRYYLPDETDMGRVRA